MAYYFFTDIDLLNVQTTAQAFGPVAGSENMQYRVTGLHTASANPNVYAVCDGLAFAQDIGNGLINIILKPTQQSKTLAYPVKYYIYKGIDANSIIDSNNPILVKIPVEVPDATRVNLLNVVKDSQDFRNAAYDKLKGNPEGTTITRASINALGLQLKANAISINNLPDDTFIDEVFQKIDIDQFPKIRGGAVLGQFKKESFGLEIVLEGIGEGPIMATARSLETIITCNPNLTSNIDKFRERDKQERILNYIDPCCFYSSFYIASNSTFTKAKQLKTNVAAFSSTLDKASTLDNEHLYQLLLKYKTADTIYLDIRNEHNHGLNYYRNYNNAGDEYAKIKIAYDGGTLAVTDYKNNYGWPILSINVSSFTQTALKQPSSISLKLPVKDNSLPSIFLSQGYFYNEYPITKNRLTDNIFPDENDTEYTILRKFAIPKLDETTTIPFYLNIRYIKRITGQIITPVNYVLKAEHYIDNLFELTQLVNANGPIIPLNNNDIVQWAYTGISVYVDKTANYGTSYIAKVGISKDIDAVWFFAMADDENFLSGSSKSTSFQNKITTEFPYLYNLNINKVTIDNTGGSPWFCGIPDVLPDNLFDLPFNPNKLEKDGRSLIAIKISDEDFSAIQQMMTVLEVDYDKRLALRKYDAESVIYGGKTYLKYEIVIRGYTISGEDIVATDIPTGIYIIKFEEDSSRIFISQKYMMNELPENEIEKNWKNFKQSYTLHDTRLNLRKSHYINDASRIIKLDGKTAFTVLGKTQILDQVWYCVEWQNTIHGFIPDTLEEDYAGPERGWIRPNINDSNIFDRQFYPVASLKKFIVDLQKLNTELDKKQIDNGFQIDTIQQRITRLRQMTHTQLWDPVKLKFDLIGIFFNQVIGSTSTNPSPQYLQDIEYIGGTQEEVTVSGITEMIDTNMQLFRDYMGVDLGKGIIIDLHHLFVGLDVLNHFGEELDVAAFKLLLITAANSLFGPAVLPIVLGLIASMPDSFGNNIDTATWAGDLGAVSADLLQESDNHSSLLAYLTFHFNKKYGYDPIQTEMDELLFEHYYKTRGSETDLITDIITHKIHRQQEIYLSQQSDFRNVEALLYYYFLTVQKEGLSSSFREFFNYMGIDTSRPVNTESQPDVYNKTYSGIHLFSQWWRLKNIFSGKNPLVYDSDLAKIDNESTTTFMNLLEVYRKK